MFENEKKKLREEEEKSFDDSIGNWFRRLRIEFECFLAHTLGSLAPRVLTCNPSFTCSPSLLVIPGNSFAPDFIFSYRYNFMFEPNKSSFDDALQTEFSFNDSPTKTERNNI